jgi:hypothetical protein
VAAVDTSFKDAAGLSHILGTAGAFGSVDSGHFSLSPPLRTSAGFGFQCGPGRIVINGAPACIQSIASATCARRVVVEFRNDLITARLIFLFALLLVLGEVRARRSAAVNFMLSPSPLLCVELGSGDVGRSRACPDRRLRHY